MRVNSQTARVLFFRTLGNFMVLMSLVGIGKTFVPALYQEGVYALRKWRKVDTKVVVAKNPKAGETPSPTLAPSNPFQQLLGQFSETTNVIRPADTNFGIVIPKIGANSPVTANVDSSNYDHYIQVLKTSVAHAQGTALPGDPGHIYLFAHSTDSILSVGTYNAVFYLLYKLEPADEILLFFKGHKHAYRVTAKRVVSPSEVHYLTRASAEEFLTLQTCWPPGTTLQRLLVFASPVVKYGRTE
jgi:LPXTG-site transpeptidase (sortase) family protein